MTFKKCSTQPTELVQFNIAAKGRVTLVLARDSEYQAWGVRVSQEGKPGSCIVEESDKAAAIGTGLNVGRDLLRIADEFHHKADALETERLKAIRERARAQDSVEWGALGNKVVTAFAETIERIQEKRQAREEIRRQRLSTEAQGSIPAFSQGHIHVWQGVRCVLVSNEATKKLVAAHDWNKAVDHVWGLGHKDVARALNEHIKAHGYNVG